MYSIIQARPIFANKGHYQNVTRQLGKFNNLVVKYYVQMANFNKIIKVLNIESAVSSQWTPMGSAIEKMHSMVFLNRVRCLDCVSR